MKNDFSRERKPNAVDDKFKSKIKQIAVKLAQDDSLKDKEVYLHLNGRICCKRHKESEH